MSVFTPLELLEEVMGIAQTPARYPTVSTRLRNWLLDQMLAYRKQFAEGAVDTAAVCEAIQDLYGSIHHMCDHAIGLRESAEFRARIDRLQAAREYVLRVTGEFQDPVGRVEILI